MVHSSASRRQIEVRAGGAFERERTADSSAAGGGFEHGGRCIQMASRWRDQRASERCVRVRPGTWTRAEKASSAELPFELCVGTLMRRSERGGEDERSGGARCVDSISTMNGLGCMDQERCANDSGDVCRTSVRWGTWCNRCVVGEVLYPLCTEIRPISLFPLGQTLPCTRPTHLHPLPDASVT